MLGVISREEWLRNQREIWYAAMGLRAAMQGLDIGPLTNVELIIFELPEVR